MSRPTKYREEFAEMALAAMRYSSPESFSHQLTPTTFNRRLNAL